MAPASLVASVSVTTSAFAEDGKAVNTLTIDTAETGKPTDDVSPSEKQATGGLNSLTGASTNEAESANAPSEPKKVAAREKPKTNVLSEDESISTPVLQNTQDLSQQESAQSLTESSKKSESKTPEIRQADNEEAGANITTEVVEENHATAGMTNKPKRAPNDPREIRKRQLEQEAQLTATQNSNAEKNESTPVIQEVAAVETVKAEQTQSPVAVIEPEKIDSPADSVDLEVVKSEKVEQVEVTAIKEDVKSGNLAEADPQVLQDATSVSTLVTSDKDKESSPDAESADAAASVSEQPLETDQKV